MKCSQCGKDRLVRIQAHCVDRFGAYQFDIKQHYDGYVPDELGIGDGDDVEITYCLDCGQIQNWKSAPGLTPVQQ